MHGCSELLRIDPRVWFQWPVIAVLLAGCLPGSDSDQSTAVAAFDYAAAERRGTCETGAKPGAGGATDGYTGSVTYNVRAPANYDPSFAHPLLVVYAAAGMTAEESEEFTGFTKAATQNGWIVAYADHKRMSVEAVRDLAKLPAEVSEKWCIDMSRVYATGHSDGGTVSTAIALLDGTRDTLAGIAPSAAGFRKSDFETFKCPSAPFPVMVMHGSWDVAFYGWGKQAAEWWASCNGCSMSEAPRPLGDGCVAYDGCARDGPTVYCEGPRLHSQWPGLSAQIIDFFDAVHGRSGMSTPSAAIERTHASAMKPHKVARIKRKSRR